jgi:hypothetical protein
MATDPAIRRNEPVRRQAIHLHLRLTEGEGIPRSGGQFRPEREEAWGYTDRISSTQGEVVLRDPLWHTKSPLARRRG